LRYNFPVRRRFFVEQFTGTSAVMEGDAAHHLGHVLRAQSGQLYELSDGTTAWLARIDSVARNRVAFALLEQLPTPQPVAEITLLLAIVKFDAFEWAIEKATELGVTKIIPLAAARSEKGLLAAAAKRSQRWQKILLESSQQSRRLRVPQLAELAKPAQVFVAQTADFRLMLSERSDAPSFRNSLAQANRANPSPSALPAAVLAIGPEGGWTEDELADARAANFQEASLGQLILRTETAVIAAIASLNYAFSTDRPA
jgi:16S rRNA (uracil1498-N3)-methyltransferase